MVSNMMFLFIVVIFFAVNMGASGIAPSFAAAYGSRLIKKKNALLLFGLFVILGAISLGSNVSMTLGKNLLPKEFLTQKSVLLILVSAAIALFLANLFRIPQSTSQVTVGAIAGAGLYFQKFYLHTLFYKIIPAWLILPALSYLFTLLLYRRIYPPERDNLHIYQKIFANRNKLKLLSLIVSCYVAFAIGTNNVANAVGPLYGAGLIGVKPGLALIAPFFFLGACLLGSGPLETTGSEIVPLGLASGVIISFVTATLLIVASCLGIPQSLVQLNLFSIFAVACVKNGHRETMGYHLTKKTLLVWLLTPLISVGVAYALLFLFN